ncbi:hypothetical protein HNR11_002714 [Nesterenkonia sandarakina]|uniref:Uncharacterized protein n=1 Tax=Nesterenkonia sandarakina TaxID=272918 RepID=A0A7Z0J4Q3_9MICC|nr:hypothetical protein [Nesterenkonia sandarakina]
MAPWLIILIGTVVFVGGIIGSFRYRTIHKRFFQGHIFQDAPPEFLLLPLWGGAGIGGVFILMGIFR